MKNVIWKCKGCKDNPCILIVKEDNGRPTECVFGIESIFENSRRWEGGSVEDLKVDFVDECKED